MNTWNGSGFITNDPDIRYATNKNGENIAIAHFSIACSRKGKDAGADFISCTAFGKLGELIEKWYHRGSGIEVRGHIQTSQWTNKEGVKQYGTTVVVDEIEFPKAKKGETSPVEQPTFNVPQEETHTSEPQQPFVPQQTAPESGFMKIPDGIEHDLPFR